MSIKIGSLFSGIGGFELGFERAIPNAETIWQVEQDKFCQKVLKKHWTNAKIYDDVKTITKDNVEPIDILLGGFPCQDISNAKTNGKGLDGEKSGLWWEMHRIIQELQPTIVCMENVAAIRKKGLKEVVESLADIGYDCEWTIIQSGAQFGAPHQRRRWFAVAYPNSNRPQKNDNKQSRLDHKGQGIWDDATSSGSITGNDQRTNYWKQNPHPTPVRRMGDGISGKLDSNRIKALGNAIVPQASQYIAECILKSGLLDEML